MKNKNIKWNKGLFRIWIVASSGWIGILLLVGFIEGGEVLGDPDFWTATFLVPPLVLLGFIFIQKILKWVYSGFK